MQTERQTFARSYLVSIDYIPDYYLQMIVIGILFVFFSVK